MIDSDAAVKELMEGSNGIAGRAAVDLLDRPAPPSVKPPKVRYTHEAMVDMILETPWISQNQLAAYFGYTPAWISTVITSDGFQAQLEARRAELIDPELRLTMQERFKALTVQSLKVLQEKLTSPNGVSDNLALRAADLGAKALGIGRETNNAVFITSEDRLASLAHRLIALKGGQGAIDSAIDVESRVVESRA